MCIGRIPEVGDDHRRGFVESRTKRQYLGRLPLYLKNGCAFSDVVKNGRRVKVPPRFLAGCKSDFPHVD
jgi:hypothetical protein